ncbi:sigma-54-dependent transcriptional regulator [Aestuariivirga sp.]|uniref:sigma-54-dependent transcriptional regulator n=1 Tax=Aestuariivirga sp. TaxID=2650926 RepID=UPI00391D1013
MLLEGHSIAVVEDDPVMGESLVQSLSLEGCTVEWWKTGEEAARGLRSLKPDAVICDIRLPDTTGEAFFREHAAVMPLPPFLFVTAFADVDQAVALMREGAADYVTKPFDVAKVITRVHSLIQRSSNLKAGSVLGVSPEMREVEGKIRRITDLTTPVLISGETGVGKEVCARFLHAVSTRSQEPFIAVNCASIPADVMEREIFGYRGASAQAFHRGFAERARGGVLFLDEIAELPLALQAKLLRLVETREYHRLGGEQNMVFHGRIVCSTNRDLQALVRDGKFREDFYYRIAGMTIDVPALRERAADIPWLVGLFLEKFRSGGDIPKAVSPPAIEAALSYAWPGNIRELRNRIERAVAMTRTPFITPGDLFPEQGVARDAAPAAAKAIVTLSEARDDAERRQIELALKETGGHMIEAARMLGVSRTTLWEKMRRLGMTTETR